jgi:phosphoglycerate kinase
MKFSIPTKEQIKNKIVILRLDLNSPEIDIKHFRFTSTKKMISYLLKNKAKQIIILAHLGRPKKDKHSVSVDGFDFYNEKLSLKSFKKPLSLLYKNDISFVKYSVFHEKFDKSLKAAKTSKIVLLENIRFYKGEEVNEIKLSKRLAALGDLYVNEAFSISHRDSSSNKAICQQMPSYFGINYLEEKQNLETIIEKSKKDLTVVIGGSKISDKLKLIFKFNKKSRFVLVGGAIANTLLHNMGFEIGQSLFEDIFIDNINKLDFNSVIMPLDVKILNKNN